VKLIKLDRRHNLYHKGYRFAFLIDRWSSDSNNIEKAVKELEGGAGTRHFGASLSLTEL
jgi:hypothetical protein